MSVTVRIKGKCYLTQVWLLVAQEYNTERQVVGKRQDSFVEEASNPGMKVDSCPKEPTPNSPGLAERLHREKKGLQAGEGAILYFQR